MSSIISPIQEMLVFQTDFGYKDSTVAAMYGVVKSVDRHIEIIDSTHELPQFDIWSASYRLWQAMRFWPKGTIFVAVTDPGVGTARKACVCYTKDGYYIVTPDNGSLTHVAKYNGIQEIREIDETINRLHHAGTDETSVFHGRDLFGYCAARLAAGIIDFEQVGPAYDPADVVKLPMPQAQYCDQKAAGMIEIDDPNFGNLFTNIDTNAFLAHGFAYGKKIHVIIRHGDDVVFDRDLPFEKSFGMVNKDEPLAYNNELMNLSFAVSQGSFVNTFHVGFGSEWTVEVTA